MSQADYLGYWYYLAKLFGYFPGVASSGNTSKGRIYDSVCNLLLSICNIVLHSCLWWNLPFNFKYLQTTMGCRIETTFNVVDSAVPIIAIVLNAIAIRRTRRVYQMLQITDRLLIDIDNNLDHNMGRRYVKIALFLILLMHFLPLVLLPLGFAQSEYYMNLLPLLIYLTFKQLSNISFLGSIIITLMVVFIRYKSVNYCLIQRFLQKDTAILPKSSVKEAVAVIDMTVIGQLCSIHHILCETVEQINRVFSFQVRFDICHLTYNNIKISLTCIAVL